MRESLYGGLCWVGFIIALGVLIWTFPKLMKDPITAPSKLDFTPTKVTGVQNVGRMTTVEHDGHKWVVFTGHYKGGFEHHPDCECMKGDK